MQRTLDVVIPAYDVADVVVDTVLTISRQRLPDDWSMNIIVYDDGSTDDTIEVLVKLKAELPSLNVVEGRQNGGRSHACNEGVAAGSGSVVVICDADCRFSRADTLGEFIRDLEAGHDVVIGFVEMSGTGFWARYTNRVMDDREYQGERKGLVTYSAANIAIRRETFDALSGFSSEYAHYGFEDKDFLLRLEQRAREVSVRPDLRVSHDDDLTLKTVCRKQFDSGRHSAAVFRRQHPDAYAAMPYARCDYTLGRMRLLAPMSALLKAATEWVAAVFLTVPASFGMRRFFVQVAICAAYFHGTRLSAGEDREDER